MEPDIEKLRDQIRTIDEQILELSSRRMQICREIGKYKKDHNLPVKDYRVEKNILEKTRSEARRLGIYPDLAQDIIKSLIKYSVIEQDEIRGQTGPQHVTESLRKVLVIGGCGNMGRWLCNFFEIMGYSVKAFDDNVDDQFPFQLAASLTDGLEWSDIIILATPMQISRDYLQKFIQERTTKLIIELGSLKSPLLDTIKKAINNSIRLVSIHPMFGPETDFLSGKNIIICDTGGDASDTKLVTDIFKLTSASVIEVPLKDHDRYMSFILGSAHLLNLMYASVLESSGINLDTLTSFAGTTFSDQIRVSRAVTLENQDLYFDIQVENSETERIFELFSSRLAALKRCIQASDRDSFKKRMEKNRQYFEN